MPEKPNTAFERNDQWWRLKYEIVEERTATGRIPLIVALPDPEEPNRYDPLRADNDPQTQPEAREENLSAPHRHLANLDLEKPDCILDFVNKWGLLGLWLVPEYQKRGPIWAPEKGLKENELDGSFSQWYFAERYKGRQGRFFHRFCEPLELFQLAAKQYQQLCAYASLADNDDATDQARVDAELDVQAGFTLFGCQLFPVYKDGQWSLAWQCRSLLDWIRLRTVLELAENSFRRCSRCGLFFRPVDPRQTFCTTRCRNAYNQGLRRRTKAEAKTLWESGFSTEEIAREVNRPLETVSKWVTDWELEGTE